MLKREIIVVSAVLLFSMGILVQAQEDNLGFTDTPFLPNSPWRVHDRNRPHPPIVEPGATCRQPPADAVVLFDGKDLSQWEGKEDISSGLEDGCINIHKAGELHSKQEFGDCQLHIEWATPAERDTENRFWWGNSGIFLLGEYELQVTESHENVHKADGQAGAIYGQTPPLANVARKPGEWQTYDVVFLAPRFEGEKLISPAYFTVFWNGVLVQYHTPCMGSTRYKTAPKYDCLDTTGPIKLQQHGSGVRFRNIWVRPLDLGVSESG